MVKPLAEISDSERVEQASSPSVIVRRSAGDSLWLSINDRGINDRSGVGDGPARELQYREFDSEEAVGLAMLAEIDQAAASKPGNLVIIIVGGRGGQALHRLLRERSESSAYDHLLKRLHIFTQDALAPLPMNNGLSFTRDFERILGPVFFEKVGSFTSMKTDADDLAGELTRYLERLESLGGVDIFFLGHGPEPGGASHLCYIRPGSGATRDDIAGVIPISGSLLEHHISKFKAGGTNVSPLDEAECRRASSILTLGPAAILRAKRVVQSIVDASTAPAKRETYLRVLEAKISNDPATRGVQLDENPGLWIRLHPNAISFILKDVLTD